MDVPVKLDRESDGRDHGVRRRCRGPRWYGRYPVQSFRLRPLAVVCPGSLCLRAKQSVRRRRLKVCAGAGSYLYVQTPCAPGSSDGEVKP